MSRENVIEDALKAVLKTWKASGVTCQPDLEGAELAVRATVLALEAAGVRLVPVEEKPGKGWLHEAVKDASLRAAKSTGAAPQMLYAPILWAMQDALTASPYAKEDNNGT